MHLKLPGVVPTGSGTFLDEIKERHRFYIFEVIFISEVVLILMLSLFSYLGICDKCRKKSVSRQDVDDCATVTEEVDGTDPAE